MGSSPGLKPPRSGCITTCWQSRSPTSLPVHRKRLRDRLRHVRGPAGRRTRVKTHKSQKSLRPSRFRLPESLEGIRKERVGSTSYAFMSVDPFEHGMEEVANPIAKGLNGSSGSGESWFDP